MTSFAAFSVAASATLNDAKLVWFASPAIVSDEWDYYVNGANTSVFMSVLNWISEKAVSVSVLAKQMQIEPLLLTEAAANVWSMVFVVVIPLAILGSGFYMWFRRRRR